MRTEGVGRDSISCLSPSPSPSPSPCSPGIPPAHHCTLTLGPPPWQDGNTLAEDLGIQAGAENALGQGCEQTFGGGFLA